MRHGEALAQEAALLAGFRAQYLGEVAAAVEAMLGHAPGGLRRWLLAPIRYAHAGRRNFFRSGLLLESAALAGRADAGPCLAACAEVGWSCALVLDDIRDRSAEREGAPSAHRKYGALRCIVSVLATLAIVARTLAWRGEASRRARLAHLGLGVTLVLRAGVAAFGRAPRSMAAYRAASRRVNASIHWALLGPHAGGPKTALHDALARYADHSAVAGKMRNDLLDYWGGSSERVSVLEDFHSRTLSFPTLVLLDAPLVAADRNRLVAHFGSGRTLASTELFALFRTYAIEERCLALLAAEIAACDAAVESLASTPRSQRFCALLKAWNRHILEGCRARLQAHS